MRAAALLAAACVLAASAASAAPAPAITSRSVIVTFAARSGLAGLALAVGRDGTVYTSSAPPDEALYRVTRSGTPSLVAAAKGLAVEGLAVAPDGSVYISSGESSKVRKIAPDGTVSTVAQGIGGPVGLALDTAGDLYAADYDGGRVWKIAPDGAKTVVARHLGSPLAVAVAPDGTLYVASITPAFSYGPIRKIDTSGRVTTFARPQGGARALAVDRTGRLFVGTSDHRVLAYDPRGRSTVVAGAGFTGYSGDGGRADEAVLSDVGALAFGPDGSLYVNDVANGAIRRITPGASKAMPLPQALAHASATTLPTPEAVAGLAADGGWVAVDERVAKGGPNGTTCDTILFWNPASARHVSARDRCDDTSRSQSIAHLALAGTRAVWVDYDYSNHASCSLVSAAADRPRPVGLGFGCGPAGDDVIGAVAGQGSLVVANHWTDCGPGVPCSKAIALPGGDTMIGPSLLVVGAASSTRIASGASSVVVAGVDAGRIVLVRPDDTVAILSAAGKVLQSVAPGAAVSGAAVQGDDLVVLTRETLLDYDAATGRLRARRALIPAATDTASLAGVEAGIAAYVTGRTVVVVDLRTGRSTAFAPASTSPVVAALRPSGLWYGYAAAGGGRLCVVAASALASAVR